MGFCFLPPHTARTSDAEAHPLQIMRKEADLRHWTMMLYLAKKCLFEEIDIQLYLRKVILQCPWSIQPGLIQCAGHLSSISMSPDLSPLGKSLLFLSSSMALHHSSSKMTNSTCHSIIPSFHRDSTVAMRKTRLLEYYSVHILQPLLAMHDQSKPITSTNRD